MNMDTFILRQKDHNVALLLIDKDGEIHSGKLLDGVRAPLCSTDDIRSVYKWWKDRAIPEGRERLSELLKQFGCISPKELLLKNLGLSLTDTYWICPEYYGELEFKDVNLFEHGGDSLGFHDAEGRIHYGTSPNAAVGGSLDKEAVKKDGNWYLEKRFNSKYPDGQQNINEVFASRISELQGWREFVPYSTKVSERGVCEKAVCKYFTSINAELISAYDITGGSGLRKDYNTEEELERFVGRCVSGGLDEEYVRHFLDYMIALDYITTNSDRHWRNFGLLRDPESLKYISFAPIFDNGNSMFFDSPYVMKRTALVRLKNTGLAEWEIDRLKLIKDKNVIKYDLLPSPEEVKSFYMEYGLNEYRADQISESYNNKLQLFSDFQHGVRISFAHEMGDDL